MSRLEVFDTGFTVVHEPKGPDSSPLVDIVFIHGLQGHPYRTWTYSPPPCKSKPTPSGSSSAAPTSTKERSFRRRLAGLATHLRKTDRGKARAKSPVPETTRDTQEQDDVGKDAAFVFWPADLLPESCPRARILVWGYDTKVAKSPGQAVSKGNVFSEGKNLLFSLRRERDLDIPIMFVAHSLGGVILKEALSISHDSGETDLENVVKSTRAVIFMGTPHRGSKDMADIGDVARRVASAFFIDTNNSMLDALGLKTQDLDRCEDSFSRVWKKINFKIKTFQEGMPYKGVDFCRLNEKVVPDQSSRIGDPTERAETLQANHMEMCRFQGKQDPNYRKVGPELELIYKSIVQTLSAPIPELQPQPERYRHSEHEIEHTEFHRKCEDVRSQLYFSEFGQRHYAIETALKDTCQRLLRSEQYQTWYNRQDLQKHRGLLWIRGKPGSGKSTLMKEAVREAREYRTSGSQHIVNFFFNAHGNNLEKSSLGFFRALLYQLLPIFPGRMHEFIEFYSSKISNGEKPVWTPQGLKNSIQSIFAQPCETQVFLFADALDECVGDGPRDIIHFLRELSADAYSAGAQLSICMSSRYYPTTTIARYLELGLEAYNGSDIAHFVERKLSMAISEDSSESIAQWDKIRHEITERASGIFLWARLVLDVLLEEYDKGKSIKFVESRLTSVPHALGDLYTQILQGTHPDELRKTAKFFSWVLLAIRPIQLREWYQLLAFIDDNPPKSLAAWRDSGDAIDNEDQLQKRIRRLSRGLVELQKVEVQENAMNEERDSILATPGSLDIGGEGSGTLQFIHESVREFFLHPSALRVLYPTVTDGTLGEAHLSIVKTCFDYLAIEELGQLLDRRMRTSGVEDYPGVNDLHLLGRAEDVTVLRKRRSVASMTSHSSASTVGSSASNYAHSTRSTQSPSDMRGSSQTHDPRFATVSITKARMEKVTTMSNDTPPPETDTSSPQKMSDVTGKSEVLRQFFDPPTESSSATEDDSDTVSDAQSSVEGSRRILTEIPCLIYYACGAVIPHAMLAERKGCDPSRLIHSLQHGLSWTRWVSLHDDMSLDTTLLYFAADQGLLSWVVYLLEIGTDPNVLGGNFGRPLLAAAHKGNGEILHRLLQGGANVSTVDPENQTVLHFLAAASNYPLWKEILEQYDQPGTLIDINAEDRFNRTPLHVAARMSHLGIVKDLVEHGAEVNSFDIWGNTPLHYASCRDDEKLEIAMYLMRSGESVQQRNYTGKLPLDLVFTNGRNNKTTDIVHYVQVAKLCSLDGIKTKKTSAAGQTAPQPSYGKHFVCYLCSRYFLRLDLLQLHYRTIHDYECSICEKRFSRANILSRHQRCTHGIERRP